MVDRGTGLAPAERGVSFAWLLFGALPVLLIYLAANAIWDANEAFYVETPRQMVLSGDYVSPTFNAEPRHNKPVLSYWIVAGLYQLFGISVGVERFGIALGALGILAATFLLGRALRSTATGILAALIIVTAPRFVMFSRRIFIDIYITLFMALGLACFALAERHPERRTRYLLLMYVAFALGALTKGPIALVLPAAVIGAWLVLQGRLGDLRTLKLLPGALIVAAVLAPWGIGMYVAHGWAPIVNFLGAENVGRFTASMVPGERPWWFFGPVLLGDLFPWAPLVLVPLIYGWRPRQSGEGATQADLRRLCWLWIVVIVAAFTASATKQDLYIFPVMPAAAVLIADAITNWLQGGRERLVRGLLVTVSGLTVLLGAGIGWTFGSGVYALAGTGFAAVALVGGGAAALVLLARDRRAGAIGALAAGFIGFNYVFVARILPDAERFKPIPAIARVVTERAGAGARLGAFGTMLPSLVFYAGRPVEEQPDLDAAVAFMSGPHEAWLLVESEEWEALNERLPALCVALRRQLFALDQKLVNIVHGIPAPDLLLVTNRCGRP